MKKSRYQSPIPFAHGASYPSLFRHPNNKLN